jgi:hypothetical protein
MLRGIGSLDLNGCRVHQYRERNGCVHRFLDGGKNGEQSRRAAADRKGHDDGDRARRSREGIRGDAQARRGEAEKQAFIDQLTKPSGVSDEEGIRRGLNMIKRAVNAGLTEVQVHRFTNKLCTDRRRAINQMEKGWEETLTGVPKEIYQL